MDVIFRKSIKGAIYGPIDLFEKGPEQPHIQF